MTEPYAERGVPHIADERDVPVPKDESPFAGDEFPMGEPGAKKDPGPRAPEPSGAEVAQIMGVQAVEDLLHAISGAYALAVLVRRTAHCAAQGRVRLRDGFVLVWAARQVYQSVTTAPKPGETLRALTS